VHLWKSRRNSLELSKKIVQLDQIIPLFIVGESYSISQGWIEGALETSQLCLEKIHA